MKTKEQKSWDNILNGYFINPKLWRHNPSVSGVDIHCAGVTLIEHKAFLALLEMFLSSFLSCQQFSHRGERCPENAHFLWLCSNAFLGKKSVMKRMSKYSNKFEQSLWGEYSNSFVEIRTFERTCRVALGTAAAILACLNNIIIMWLASIQRPGVHNVACSPCRLLYLSHVASHGMHVRV